MVVRVGFLQHKPVIDGSPKPSSQTLSPLHLAPSPVGSTSAQQPPVRLRLGYGAEFLYLQVEFPADRLVARDRGYQFGDGIVLTIADTSDGAPADRYYMLGFSHQETSQFLWASRVLWEHDRRSQLLPLGRAVEVAGTARDGSGRLEVTVPWSLVHPYHPWVSDAIGLNVLFVKARGESETELYGLLPPEGDEQVARSSVPARFDDPRLRCGHQIAVVAPGRVTHGSPLRASVAVCAAGEVEDRLSARILTGEGDLIALDRQPLAVGVGLTRAAWELKTDFLAPGGYRIQWRSAHSAIESEQGLTVLPAVDDADMGARLSAARGTLPDPDASTLAFEAENLAARLSRLAPLRTAGVERVELERLGADLRAAETGENPVARRRGIFRRAFRSGIDGTLQPFSVIVPSDYRGEPWPLCVAFHGSGVDDLQFLWSMGASAFPPRVLVAAPFGRGASNAFTQGDAQRDVAEAVASMCSAYPVDPDRIFLVGFSMGAYGALRTYYEDARRYRAVALFCTPPAADLEGETHPDFTQPEFAGAFRATRVFVFHGRRDHSTPFADAERMVFALRAAGADVAFAVEDDAGHQLPNAKTLGLYQRWVDRCIRS